MMLYCLPCTRRLQRELEASRSCPEEALCLRLKRQLEQLQRRCYQQQMRQQLTLQQRRRNGGPAKSTPRITAGSGGGGGGGGGKGDGRISNKGKGRYSSALSTSQSHSASYSRRDSSALSSSSSSSSFHQSLLSQQAENELLDEELVTPGLIDAVFSDDSTDSECGVSLVGDEWLMDDGGEDGEEEEEEAETDKMFGEVANMNGNGNWADLDESELASFESDLLEEQDKAGGGELWVQGQ